MSRRPVEVIRELADTRRGRSDDELLAELSAMAPLPDESDPAWDSDEFWHTEAYRYLAIAGLVADRRLRAAVPLLLDRACYGDPGEIMRGLCHSCEHAYEPDWPALADVCMAASRSPRPGTRMWAMHQLMRLNDPSARPVFEAALANELEEIAWMAEAGLERLRGREDAA